MKVKDICDKKSCSGCEACFNACAHQAIIMRSDWRGFLYPAIDKDKCVGCGLCRKVCPSNKPRTSFTYPFTTVFIERDRHYLMKASSGGAFGVMARHIISEGGIVFGCSMDEVYDVKFMAVDTIEGLDKLYGSKYVQSKVGDIYRQIKLCLNAGRKVLFCGCPCHVAGLKAYLHKDTDNLITMDLICHGVPSQPYFKAYVNDLLSRKAQLGTTIFRFRYKPEIGCETQYGQNVHIGFHNRDYYMTYFLWGKTYRDSCYSCRFAGGSRPADFTIGDFWNQTEAQFSIDVKDGSSLVLFNTDKAKQYLTVFRNNGTCVEVPTFQQAMGKNGGQLHHPCRNDFRTNLMYLLFKLFGVRGPKALFALECIRCKI